MKYVWIVLTVVLSIGTLIWIQNERQHRLTEQLVEQAELAFHRGQFDQTRTLADQILRQHPKDSHFLLIAALSASSGPDPSVCNRYLEQIEKSDRVTASRRASSLGKETFQQGRARCAEQYLRLALQLDAQNDEAVFMLAFVLGSEGRARESVLLNRQLIESGHYDAHQLFLVGAPDVFFIPRPDITERCLRVVPDDPLPLLASARSALLQNDEVTAERHLLRITAHDPTLVDPQARLGLLLVNRLDAKPYLTWNQKLGACGEDYPEIWASRGLFALQHNEPQVAIRCFAQSARLDPNYTLPLFHLSRLLHEAGQWPLAQQIQNRVELLSELTEALRTCSIKIESTLVQRICEICEALGRPCEAVAWSDLLLRTQTDLKWALELTTRVRQQFGNQPPWIVDEARIADQIAIERYPLPRWHREFPAASNQRPGVSPVSDTRIRFRDDATRLGINFKYYNDAKSSENIERVFEYAGGGLAVIDFDGDGWPDLYAAQGARFPQETQSPVYLDRLFRNQGGTRFLDVTETCGIREPDYSQGVAVGDVDQDGFPDLYVANIGPDRLWKNCGDGTFLEATTAAGLVDHDWTTSCCLADLNGDSFPEIYAVNYLTAPDVYTRFCAAGTPENHCSPSNFEPQPDRIWRNLGDGRFEEQTSCLIMEKFFGRGLGVVVAPLDRPDRPNIYVANDTDPNFWYVNQVLERGGALHFEESGAVDGLALSGEGQVQGCMGIAFGDVNRDGLQDFFVTNFFRESNTLYLQQPGRTFLDQTRRSGLHEPSVHMLGFGTQFLDADLDGWLDLVVANGHVFNNSAINEPYRMRTQFFRNRNQGQFDELRGSQAGTYFEGEYLGRAVVNWDWNRDGFPDLAVSHLDAPLAALTNVSKTPCHPLVLSLRGTNSNREAIGAIIHVTAGSDQWITSLNAGDGYFASNDRRLIVGIGPREIVDEVQIDWPSGKSQIVQNLPTGKEFLIVEDRPPIEMRSFKNIQTSNPDDRD